ncbi:hypothetical protein KR093_002193, partial [Drosophila rubida]
ICNKYSQINQYQSLIGSNFSTRVEYKQVTRVPKDLISRLEPFKLIGQKYYYNATTEMNWFQAAQKCRKLGGNLINLASNQERQIISLNLDKTKKYWLDINNLGQTEYVSIATGSNAEYVKWFEEDVHDNNIEDEKCVALVNDYQDDGFVMKKMNCLEKCRYICQLTSPRTISVLVW